jgi:hypothetical protein
MKHETRPPFPGPFLKVFPAEGFHSGQKDHGYYPLVVGGFAYLLKFLIFADFVGPFPFREVLADFGK